MDGLLEQRLQLTYLVELFVVEVFKCFFDILGVELRLNGVHVLDQAHFKIILNIFIQHRLVVDIFQQLRDIVRSLLQVQAEGLNKFCVNLYLLDSILEKN